MSQSPNAQRHRATLARPHPAAARRAVRRRQRRELMTFGVEMVQAGRGRPGDFLSTAIVTLMCSACPGMAWGRSERPAPKVWELASVELATAVAELVTVAVRPSGRNARAEGQRIRQQERRTVAGLVRGPDWGRISGPNPVWLTHATATRM